MLKKTCLAIAVFLSAAGVLQITRWIAAAPQNRAARPFYYERQITPDDLKDRTLRELALMRNTIYARAGNPFRKKWLNDYFSAQPWYHPLAQIDQSKLTELDRKNAEIIANFDGSVSRLDLLARLKALQARGADTSEGKIELRLLSMRLGNWAGAANEDRTPLEDPSLLDKQVGVDQLRDFSRRDLRLLRNLVYARRGRPFRSALLQSYFGTLAWYKPDPKYTDVRLTPLDKRNIKVILSVEDSLGGPLTDYQHKKEEGWFAAA